MPGTPDVVQEQMQDTEVVRRLFDAMRDGSVEEVRPLLADELVAFPIVGGSSPVVRGSEAFLSRLTILRSEGLEWGVDEIEEVKPGYVLASGSATHRAKSYALHVLVQVRDGCIRMMESHTSRDQALATIGR